MLDGSENPQPLYPGETGRPWGDSRPKESAMFKQWWIVRQMRPSPMTGPAYRHSSFLQAEREARWLSSNNPGVPFAVCELRSILITNPETAQTERLQFKRRKRSSPKEPAELPGG